MQEKQEKKISPGNLQVTHSQYDLFCQLDYLIITFLKRHLFCIVACKNRNLKRFLNELQFKLLGKII